MNLETYIDIDGHELSIYENERMTIYYKDESRETRVCHILDGPAFIGYKPNGLENCYVERYYIDGVCYYYKRYEDGKVTMEGESDEIHLDVDGEKVSYYCQLLRLSYD